MADDAEKFLSKISKHIEGEDVKEAQQIREKAEENPSEVRDKVSELVDLSKCGKILAMNAASAAIFEIASEFPEDIRPVIDDIKTLLDSYDIPKGYIALTLSHVAREYPADVRPLVPDFRPLVQQCSEISGHQKIGVCRGALLALNNVAETYPEDVVPLMSDLEPALSSDRPEVRQDALALAARIVEEEPREVLPLFDSLRQLLTDESEEVRLNACRVIGLIGAGGESVDEVKPASDRVRNLLDEDREVSRRVAVFTLAIIGAEHPEEALSALDRLRSMLRNDTAPVQSTVLRLLAVIAEQRPSEVGAAGQEVIRFLDHDPPHSSLAAYILATISDEYPDLVRPHSDQISKLIEDHPEELEEQGLDFGQAHAVISSHFRTGSMASELGSGGQTDPDGSEKPRVTPSGHITEKDIISGGRLPTETYLRLDERAPNQVESAPSVSAPLDPQEYETFEKIGQGGNADVYRARLPSGRAVGVKQPRMLGTMDASTDELLAEAQGWSEVDDHTNVVEIIDWGRSPASVPTIVMEYMSGGHLGERMDEMGFDESLWTTVGIVRGIAHAHRRGRVHLDLKPSNILFDTDENWAVPRIADWGLSRSLINASNHSPPRTLLYAAPEQHRPEKYGGIDHRTDVYQLGLVLYEMLTGEFPFGQTPEEVMTGKLFDDPTRPSEVSDNNLPAVLDEPIMRSLSRSPEERYEMAQYLRDDLLQTINQI